MTNQAAAEIQSRPTTKMIVAANLAARLPILRFDEPSCGEDDAPVLGRLVNRPGSILVTLTGDGAEACASALKDLGQMSLNLGIDGETVDGVLHAMETTLHLTVSAIATLPGEVQVNLMTCYESHGVDPATLPDAM